MAGVKGRSGGARAGAGRKPKPPEPPAPPVVLDEGLDMLAMLQAVALGRVEATPLQVRAAIAAVQYTHTKKGDGGKKDDQADAAKKAAGGKFASAQPPRLVSSR